MNARTLIENNGLVKDYFNMANDVISEKTPSEDDCHTLLEGALKIANIIEENDDPILAHNFDGRWDDFKKRIRSYADPATLQFFETEIEKTLKKHLD